MSECESDRPTQCFKISPAAVDAAKHALMQMDLEHDSYEDIARGVLLAAAEASEVPDASQKAEPLPRKLLPRSEWTVHFSDDCLIVGAHERGGYRSFTKVMLSNLK